jgi:hypothetical protein
MAHRVAQLGSDLPWEDTATWVGGVVPNSADTWEIPVGSGVVIDGGISGIFVYLQSGAGIVRGRLDYIGIGYQMWLGFTDGYTITVDGGEMVMSNAAEIKGAVLVQNGGSLDVVDASGTPVLIAGEGGTIINSGDTFAPMQIHVLSGGLAEISGIMESTEVTVTTGGALVLDGSNGTGSVLLIVAYAGAAVQTINEALPPIPANLPCILTTDLPTAADVREGVSYAGVIGSAQDLRSSLLAGQNLKPGLLDSSGGLKPSLLAL